MTTNTKSIKVSSKGQITLPKSFLKNLNVQAGQFINISLQNQTIRISNPNLLLTEKLRKIAGSVKPKVTTNTSLNEQIDEAISDHFQNIKL